MTVWMLSQFSKEPVNDWDWPVASSYSNGHVCVHPADPNTGWALVKCDSAQQQIEAAAQDPRVRPYRTLWDPLTPETINAYASVGAAQGMMLGQLLQRLAQTDPALYATA